MNSRHERRTFGVLRDGRGVRNPNEKSTTTTNNIPFAYSPMRKSSLKESYSKAWEGLRRVPVVPANEQRVERKRVVGIYIVWPNFHSKETRSLHVLLFFFPFIFSFLFIFVSFFTPSFIYIYIYLYVNIFISMNFQLIYSNSIFKYSSFYDPVLSLIINM